MLMLDHIRKELEESKKSIDEHIVLGTLPTHSEYMIYCGESRGIAKAIQILKEIYKMDEDNDR